jgi:hypothetical protein
MKSSNYKQSWGMLSNSESLCSYF